MPTWNPSRSPDTYPAAWHEIIRRPPGQHTLALLSSRAEFERLTRNWRNFTGTLRAHPSHHTAKVYLQHAYRLRGTQKEGGEWLVEVLSRRKFALDPLTARVLFPPTDSY